MNKTLLSAALLALLGCGAAVMSIDETGEEEAIESLRHELGSRVRERFGDEARIERTFGRGDQLILGIAFEAVEPDTDVEPAMALASYDRTLDALEALATEASYREAARVGEQTALLDTAGALTLLSASGERRSLAETVEGDLVSAPDGQSIAMALKGIADDPGETAVALADFAGNLSVVADGEGVDDRPALSPDGVTVVFVSARTGVASLWRTSRSGGEAVQITNAGIEAGLERPDEVDPAGFVPVPVNVSRVQWLSKDLLRYDAGGGVWWRVDISTGQATREGGTP